MVLGIIAAALSYTGIPAIILGAIALSKSNKYLAVYGQTNGKIKAGRITGRIGLIAGIVFTAIWTLYILVFLLMFLGAITYFAGFQVDHSAVEFSLMIRNFGNFIF